MASISELITTGLHCACGCHEGAGGLCLWAFCILLGRGCGSAGRVPGLQHQQRGAAASCPGCCVCSDTNLGELTPPSWELGSPQCCGSGWSSSQGNLYSRSICTPEIPGIISSYRLKISLLIPMGSGIILWMWLFLGCSCQSASVDVACTHFISPNCCMSLH